MPPGWHVALPRMTAGSRVLLKTSPDYGLLPKNDLPLPEDYGRASVVVFDLELLGWISKSSFTVQGEDPAAVFKSVRRKGEGWEHPVPPSEAVVTYRIRALPGPSECSADMPLGTGQVLQEQRAVQLALEDRDLPRALGTTLPDMTRGEISVVRVPVSWLGSSGGGAAADQGKAAGARLVDLEIELHSIVQVRDIRGDGSLLKRRLQEGTGEFPVDCPLQDCPGRVHCRGWALGGESSSSSGDRGTVGLEAGPDGWMVAIPGGAEVFLDTRGGQAGAAPVDLWIGDGSLPQGVEEAVRLMVPGERALVECPADLAAAQAPAAGREWSAPPDSALCVFEVELVSFERPPGADVQDFLVHMDYLDRLKALGNALFKSGRHQLAKDKYNKVYRVVDNPSFGHLLQGPDQEARCYTTIIQVLLNLAACDQQLGAFVEARQWCDRVLQFDPQNIKALYRRSQAYLGWVPGMKR